MELLKPRDPVTQKAKGLVVLRDRGFRVPKFCVFRESREDVEQAEGVNTAEYPPYMSYPLFARPCPVRPRHGFVDSRVVHNWKELQAVWLETLDADPDGEVLVSGYVEAEFNAVVTPTSLVVGSGNDGATAGRQVIGLPLVRTRRFKPRMLEDAGIQSEEDPYLEAVLPLGWEHGSGASGETHERWFLTQLRAGVRAEYGTGNYIPRTIEKISHVVNPETFTLLEWEQYVQTMGEDEVVYHPDGSMTSHYAIHAIMHTKAFITHGVAPEVGKSLQQAVTKPIVYDPQEFLRGVMLGDILGQRLGAKNTDLQTTMALVGLYNSLALDGKNSLWIGVSLALLMKLGSLALRGEARHIGGKAQRSRGTVYTYYANKPLAYHARFCRRWAHIFEHGSFGSTAVGGTKWAACAEGVVRLVKCVAWAAKHPSDAAVRDAVCEMNYVVDLAHNNGWWLNKFATATVYERVQRGYLPTLLEGAQFLPAIMDIGDAIPVGSPHYTENLAIFQKWVPRALKVKVTYDSARFDRLATGGIGQKAVLSIKAKDSLLREHRKPVQVYFPIDQWKAIVERIASQGITFKGKEVRFHNAETGERITLNKLDSE